MASFAQFFGGTVGLGVAEPVFLKYAPDAPAELVKESPMAIHDAARRYDSRRRPQLHGSAEGCVRLGRTSRAPCAVVGFHHSEFKDREDGAACPNFGEGRAVEFNRHGGGRK